VTPGVLRVAVGQAVARSGDVQANAVRAAALVEQAAAGGARVLVLPELFLPGYDLPALARDTGPDLVGADDHRLEPVREVCRRTGTVALLSASMPAPAGRTISIVAVDGEGGATRAYDKQHVFGDEAAVFTQGGHGAALDLDGWRLGLGVCYDGCFPEHARAAADAGAWAYLVPAAYVLGSEHRRDLYYAARALDNGMYVAMAGLVGQCGGAGFGGGSAIYDPEGRRIAGVADGEEGLALADLDPATVSATRSAQTMGRDRLPDLGPVELVTAS
jgi:predicted amidohydrolase